jgi:hypothetical protein
MRSSKPSTVASEPNASTPIGSCPLRTPPGKSGELAQILQRRTAPRDDRQSTADFAAKPRRRHPARQRDPSRKTLTPGGPKFGLAARAWAQPPNLGALVPPCNAAKLAQALVHFSIAPPQKRRLLGLLYPLSTALRQWLTPRWRIINV